MSKPDILGTDLSFPIMVDPGGDIAATSGMPNLRHSIMDILEDCLGEVLYHEKMGVGLPEEIHRKDSNTRTRIAHRFKEQILEYEARVVDITIQCEMDHDTGEYYLDVTYYDTTYHHEDNFIYPLRLSNEE